MNSFELAAVVFGVLLVVTNAYWIRYTRQIESGIELAREWDSVERRSDRAEHEIYEHVETAAQKIDGQPADIPDEIDRLDETIDELEAEIGNLREAWADSWLDALQQEMVDANRFQVVHVSLPYGSSEEVKTFGRQLLSYPDMVGIVTSAADGSFAVGVGEHVADQHPANEVASRVVSAAGAGGCGGSDRLAAGGGGPPEATEAAAETVCDEIRTAQHND